MKKETPSNRFQLTIPKAVREGLDLQEVKQLSIDVKGKIIELVPESSMEKMRGIFLGANTEDYRDRKDRV